MPGVKRTATSSLFATIPNASDNFTNSLYPEGTPSEVIAEILKDMQKLNVTPTVVHANYILKAYARALRLPRVQKDLKLREANLKGLFDVLDSMKDGSNQLLPAVGLDLYSLNTAVKACCVGGVPLKGLEVRRSGEERGDALF